MKTIGLIGGMSWESTVTYYQIINRTVKQQLGGLHSAKCLLYSVDFQEIEQHQSSGNWDASGKILRDMAKNLEQAGADCIVLCTNTMHKVAPAIEENISVPFLHIADVTADALLQQKVKKVALLGTKYTMEQDFYKGRLVAKNIEVVVPTTAARERMNTIIFDELCLGKVTQSSKEFVLDVIQELCESGATGVILGCTEIGLLVSQADSPYKLFDTTLIHAEQAALFALR